MSDLIANWPAPAHVRALTTTRTPGVSRPPFASNNLALHVHDQDDDVYANRTALINRLGLKHEPAWLNQTHSSRCVNIDTESDRDADAAITKQLDHPLAILTADCLPIILCDLSGTEIAAIHAGWRGLANGIIQQTMTRMASSPQDLMAWIGPGICHRCYPTGQEVYEHFTQQYDFSKPAFYHQSGQLHANLPQLAEFILTHNGVKSIHQSGICTFEAHDRFYSYRRASETGRIATLIWLTRG